MLKKFKGFLRATAKGPQAPPANAVVIRNIPVTAGKEKSSNDVVVTRLVMAKDSPAVTDAERRPWGTPVVVEVTDAAEKSRILHGWAWASVSKINDTLRRNYVAAQEEWLQAIPAGAVGFCHLEGHGLVMASECPGSRDITGVTQVAFFPAERRADGKFCYKPTGVKATDGREMLSPVAIMWPREAAKLIRVVVE